MRATCSRPHTLAFEPVCRQSLHHARWAIGGPSCKQHMPTRKREGQTLSSFRDARRCEMSAPRARCGHHETNRKGAGQAEQKGPARGGDAQAKRDRRRAGGTQRARAQRGTTPSTSSSSQRCIWCGYCAIGDRQPRMAAIHLHTYRYANVQVPTTRMYRYARGRELARFCYCSP